ncbi:MAG TPA: cobalamin B12-binding domain-containing protein [Clostridiaceae bacterium]|nr:cobalamin B12-binding domain-containing protein [Clostridiaceae bacterium]
MKGKIIAGAIGNCVHVAGVVRFLNLAQELGYEVRFLGAAVPVDEFIQEIHDYEPDIVGLSYRLTPEVAERLLQDFKNKMGEKALAKYRFAFAGTPPVCQVAEKTGIFERCFTGLENTSKVMEFLGCDDGICVAKKSSDNLIDRMEAANPTPLLRHHFGLPDLEKTIQGIRTIAEADILDVISIAPDQNAQESFFRPEEMDPMQSGGGGVPIRHKDDLIRIKEASRAGNYPLLRIYSGTRDLVSWAKLSKETINNAWGAIPLCWYSVLDGRSKRIPEIAIKENQEAMRWYGENDIPLEVNEAHHWSLRDAHDAIAVVMAYLAAYNAKDMGVKHYIAQYMFNSPPMITPVMDLAKMLAKIQLIESLHDKDFTSYRQARAGLLHLSPRENVAKGQLAASTVHALQIKPHIIHVVGYCEGDHAAEARDVIESCEIVQGVIRNCVSGNADSKLDHVVINRKDELLREASVILDAIVNLSKMMGKQDIDPFTDPEVLAEAIKVGILDAPHLKGNPCAAGRLETRCIEGGIDAWCKKEERRIFEKERLSRFMNRQVSLKTHV